MSSRVYITMSRKGDVLVEQSMNGKLSNVRPSTAKSSTASGSSNSNDIQNGTFK